MRVRRVAKVRQDATHMEHGRELNAKFARCMNRNCDTRRFANSGRLYAGPDTTPERSVQENHIAPHASLRTLPSQLADGKRNLVGPQDKSPLTAGLHNGRTKEQIA
jgi:hypothetical protein